jgi:hypothetical protein
MKTDPEFGPSDPCLTWPEAQLWRAVLFRAVLDAQHGSQAMARDVLRWVDTKDFERVLVWAGFELEQGRRAAKYLRELCTERASQSVKATNRPVPVKTQAPRIDTDEINLDDLSEFCDDALLTLISTAQEISQARKAACPKGHRLPPFRVAEAMAGASV